MVIELLVIGDKQLFGINNLLHYHKYKQIIYMLTEPLFYQFIWCNMR